MIGDPVNDASCLGQVTQSARNAAGTDPIRDLATRFRNAQELAAWIRQLPQRNDLGDPYDGPRVHCDVSQRLRIPAEDPNCVERSALYLAAAETIDPRPIRQLATIETPLGRHTFPVENDQPIKLEPRLTRNALEAGLYRMDDSRIALSPEETIEWALSIAAEPALDYPNGVERLRNAAHGISTIFGGGLPRRNASADIGFAFAMAEKAARMFGQQGLDLVHTGLTAINEIANRRRNFSFRLGGFRVKPNTKAIAKFAALGHRLGQKAGKAYVRGYLASIGINPQWLDEFDAELARERKGAR